MDALIECSDSTAQSNLRENAYEVVVYPGHALAQAHPDRLATLAHLFGLCAPAVHRARVLELGCGDGLNLISIAQGFPGAECIGLDLAAAGIEKGRQIIDRLRLKNVALWQRDICETGTELGHFDYIIAHGLYSWVPLQVRDRLLEICRDHLSGNGVAYISYNTYPGCHQRQMVRGMMRFHVQHMEAPAEKVSQARALIGFLAERCVDDPPFYGSILERELERLTACLDSSVFHDDLSDTNEPVHFHEFIEHAQRYGLQYLAEAQFFEMQSGIFSAEVIDVVNRIADDRIAKEQYLDFLKCRSFRQTLLVRADHKLDLQSRAGKITSLHVASPLGAESTVADLASEASVTFQGPKKSSLTTDNPVIKAALVRLGELWPQAIPFNELIDFARARVRADDTSSNWQAQDARTLAETLLKAYAGGLIELSVSPPRLVARPGVRPIASPLARVQAEASARVTNLRHHNLDIEDPFCLAVLKLLDGTRDRHDLLREIEQRAGMAQASGEACAGDAMDPSLEDALLLLGRMGLLTA